MIRAKKVIAIIILMLISVFGISQSKNELTPEQKKLIVNAWYESPRETKGNIVTFRNQRHKFESGVDMAGYENSEMIVKKDNTFSVALWKWCPNNNEVSSGKYTLSENLMTLDFSTKTCQCEIKILELEKDKLKIEITQK